jgi:5'-3' exonuclease
MNVLYAYKTFKCDHTVLAFDNYSWRNAFYPEYKKHRRDKLKQDPKEEKIAKEVGNFLQSFYNFCIENTNIICLESYGCEADDLVAGWVQHHPDDEHIIISSDSDFLQLLGDNVDMFDKRTSTLFHRGVKYKEAAFNKRHGVAEIYGLKWVEQDQYDPSWSLFEKVCKGDKQSDNITRSVPPRMRTTKLKAIFEDPENNGFEDLMSQVRTDEPNRPTVAELFERNIQLIDLTAQPDEIKELIKEVIDEAKEKELISNVGYKFTGFCSEYNLNAIKKILPDVVKPFAKFYYKEQNDGL